MNLYKWLYSRLGGRPWTYLIRDFYHELEYFIIIGMMTLGYFLPRWLTLPQYLVVVGAVTSGYILGHLFWGTRYIPGQRNNDQRYNPRRLSRKGDENGHS